jgi:hypothetical protein
LVVGGAPGRIRTCDTRFRKSHVPDPYACYQRLQFVQRRTKVAQRHDLPHVAPRSAPRIAGRYRWEGVAAVGGWFAFGVGPVVAA